VAKVPFHATIEPLERRTQVVQLRADHLTFEQIGRTLGINKSTAKRAYDAAMADSRERSIEAAEAHKAAELAVLSAVRVKLLGILNAQHPYVNDGRVVQGVKDVGPNIAAARELRQLSERMSKLLGLDAPSRRIVEVVTEDIVDAELRRLIAEEAELTGDADQPC
jgi:hypothetical protein